MKWQPYDPEWLAILAEEQAPEEKRLPAALRACRRYLEESPAYCRFVSADNPNQPGSAWQFERNIVLQHSEEGELILDVLKDGSVGGVEFLDRL